MQIRLTRISNKESIGELLAERTKAVKVYASLLLILLNLAALSPPSWAQMKVRLNWSATAGTQSGFWIAQEEGIFRKNGLDVELLHIPSSSRAIQTMLAGEIAISYGDGPEYAAITLGSTRSYIRTNEEITRRVIRSYAEAVHLLKTDKTVGMRVIRKYTRVNDREILAGTYGESRDYLESVPYVSRKGLEMILAELAEKDLKARQAKPEDFLDMRFVAELEREGFFKKLREK